MFEKLAEDILTLTLIKLADYSFMEKLANPLGITTGAQLMQHISNNSDFFLNNMKKAIQSGKFSNNVGVLKKFRNLLHSNPELLSASNKLDFTRYLDNHLAQAAQGLKNVAIPTAASTNADRIRRAVRRSRVGAVTNGIPDFGAFVV